MTRPLSTEVRSALNLAIDHVLYKRGLHEGTIDEICVEAGVGKPALYRHFGSREQLLVDYLQRRREQRSVLITEAMNAAGLDPKKRVMALVNWIADWIESDDFVGCGFHRALLQRPDGDEQISEIALLQKKWLQRTIAKELGSIIKNSATIARHLFLLIEGSMAAAMYEPNRRSGSDLRRLARTLISQ
ncbi:MAG: TetR/AcrR family transcriptional regulator [Actinomycetota bacterium]